MSGMFVNFPEMSTLAEKDTNGAIWEIMRHVVIGSLDRLDLYNKELGVPPISVRPMVAAWFLFGFDKYFDSQIELESYLPPEALASALDLRPQSARDTQLSRLQAALIAGGFKGRDRKAFSEAKANFLTMVLESEIQKFSSNQENVNNVISEYLEAVKKSRKLGEDALVGKNPSAEPPKYQIEYFVEAGWGPDRPTSIEKLGFLRPVLNSVVDNSVHGDERSFCQIKPLSSDNSKYAKVITVEPGEKYRALFISR